MKRVIALLLTAMILLSFSACGKKEKEERINMESGFPNESDL